MIIVLKYINNWFNIHVYSFEWPTSNTDYSKVSDQSTYIILYISLSHVSTSPLTGFTADFWKWIPWHFPDINDCGVHIIYYWPLKQIMHGHSVQMIQCILGYKFIYFYFYKTPGHFPDILIILKLLQEQVAQLVSKYLNKLNEITELGFLKYHRNVNKCYI